MLMQTITGMMIGTVLWFVFGYGLVFGETFQGSGFIGDFREAFFANTPVFDCRPDVPTIPTLLYATFQMVI